MKRISIEAASTNSMLGGECQVEIRERTPATADCQSGRLMRKPGRSGSGHTFELSVAGQYFSCSARHPWLCHGTTTDIALLAVADVLADFLATPQNSCTEIARRAARSHPRPVTRTMHAQSNGRCRWLDANYRAHSGAAHSGSGTVLTTSCFLVDSIRLLSRFHCCVSLLRRGSIYGQYGSVSRKISPLVAPAPFPAFVNSAFSNEIVAMDRSCISFYLRSVSRRCSLTLNSAGLPPASIRREMQIDAPPLPAT